jgi:proton-translocating NADH-quinone oxidoreductase chain N
LNGFGLIAPELILLFGGLVVFLLNVFESDEEQGSGNGYVAITVLWLLAALVAAYFQIDLEPQVAFTMMDIDAFATFFKITILVGMSLVAISGGAYMNKRTAHTGEFWSMYLFVTLAMCIAASANNLVLLYIAIEFLSITSYILAGFLRDDPRSAEAGLKYFLFGSVASAVMLYGISLLYGVTGTLDLREIGVVLAEVEGLSGVVVPAALLALVGFGFKMSLAPFYQWAPDTYDGAPTPVTAYLSTASKAIGFAVTVRVFVVALSTYIVDWAPLLAGLSMLTMTMGNLIALRQTSVKRLLAYSSVAQAGYILMGLAAVAAGAQSGMDGLNGVLIYLFAYLFTNVGAFLVVMVIEEKVGSTDISAYAGLSSRAPALAFMFMIFLLSLAGIPATGGFLGKFYVFGAAIQRQYFWLAGVALINAGVAAWYYVNIIRVMFFASEEETTGAPLTVPIAMSSVLVICTIFTLWIGLYPPNFIDWANTAAQQLLAIGF